MSAAARSGPRPATLIIVADDYGYARSYDEGILAAVRAQAVDAISAMALRATDAETLVSACDRAEVEIGLHLEPVTETSLARQVAAFRDAFGQAPVYLDGHHHCHADAAVAGKVASAAVELGIPVRSVGEAHRALLRQAGVATADRLVGRTSEEAPVVPAEVEAWLAGASPEGVTEWMVHPGRSGGPSSYDAGRERDLRELCRLGDRARWAGLGVLRAPPSRAGLR